MAVIILIFLGPEQVNQKRQDYKPCIGASRHLAPFKLANSLEQGGKIMGCQKIIDADLEVLSLGLLSVCDRKSVKIAGIDFLEDLDPVDPAHRTSLATPLQHLFDLVRLSFENGLHSAIRRVPNPSRDSDQLRGVTGICPEENPLDPSRDPDVRPTFFHLDLRRKSVLIEHPDEFILVHYPYSQLLSLGQFGAGVRAGNDDIGFPADAVRNPCAFCRRLSPPPPAGSLRKASR